MKDGKALFWAVCSMCPEWGLGLGTVRPFASAGQCLSKYLLPIQIRFPVVLGPFRAVDMAGLWLLGRPRVLWSVLWTIVRLEFCHTGARSPSSGWAMWDCQWPSDSPVL